MCSRLEGHGQGSGVYRYAVDVGYIPILLQHYPRLKMVILYISQFNLFKILPFPKSACFFSCVACLLSAGAHPVSVCGRFNRLTPLIFPHYLYPRICHCLILLTQTRTDLFPETF
jgi:hypothetical protein